MAQSYILLVAMAAAISGWHLVGRVRGLLLRHRLLDLPNERSSHTAATPRGGGLAVLGVVLPAWLLLAWLLPQQNQAGAATLWLIPAGALVLVAVSFVDDWRGVSQLSRLLVQAIVVAAVVPTLSGAVFQGLLPPLLDALAAAVLWLWFINLFNFMDGIDGIAGVETIAIGAGIYLIGTLFGPLSAAHGQGLAIAATMAGFLFWNWHPARIFLGDVGSIPLGFLLGWLLLALAASGLWHAAVILPLYYLADASLTLLRRVCRGEPVWRAHRQHCYQVAVQRGRRHSTVAGAIAGTNAVLVVFALASAAPAQRSALAWFALAAAVVAVALLMLWMVYGGQRRAANSA